MAVRSVFSGFSVNGEKRQTPSDDGRGLPDAKFVGGWVRGGRVTSRPNGAQVDFEGWRGGGRGGFVEEIWKVKLESLGPVSLRSKG